MQEFKETLSIWWKDSSQFARICGFWTIIGSTLILAVLTATGILWKLLVVLAVIGVPTVTILSVIFVTESLTEANRKRKRRDQIRDAYGYKQFEFIDNE